MCALSYLIYFCISKSTKTKVNKAIYKLKDAALIISIEINKAKAAHVAYQEVQTSDKRVKDDFEKKQWD